MEETRMQKIQRWELLVKERQDNGMSVSQFCKAKGYTENMYYHWITQIHKFDPDFDTRGKASISAPQTGSFVEIGAGARCRSLEPQPDSGWESGNAPMASIEAGSIRISLLQNADVPFLRQLLEAVQHA